MCTSTVPIDALACCGTVANRPLVQADNYLLTCMRAAYTALFRPHLDHDVINDIRLALHQNLPLGDSRFHATIEAMTGVRRAARPRGRPRMEESTSDETTPGQGELKID